MLKTGTTIEDGDPILKLLQGVSRPEIQLGMGIHSELDVYIKSEVPKTLKTMPVIRTGSAVIELVLTKNCQPETLSITCTLPLTCLKLVITSSTKNQKE